MAKNENRVAPIKITDGKGNTYELDFSRESVKFAESRGFDISNLLTFPQTNIPALWYYAFRKNHKNVARNKTDELLEAMGGLRDVEIERLIQLYNQPNESLINTEEGERKNSQITVEM